MITTTSQSFPNTKRLRKAREFKTALDEGTKVVSPVIVTVARKAAEENSRLGLIVSKKVGNSVTRNRVKRYIRESFRKLPEEKALNGYDIVVIGRAMAAQTNQVTVNQHLEQCLQRLAKKLENR